jgi:toxin YoeB
MTILKKITKLVEGITESPFEGIGKPEPLKYNLTGC